MVTDDFFLAVRTTVMPDKYTPLLNPLLGGRGNRVVLSDDV